MTKNNFFENIKYESTNLNLSSGFDNDLSFSINGEKLEIPAQLTREKIKILGEFTFGEGENFDFIKYNDFRHCIDKFSSAVDECEYYESEVLKKIAVYLELELGINISFTDTFSRMLANNELTEDYEQMKDKNFSFENLYQKYQEQTLRR